MFRTGKVAGILAILACVSIFGTGVSAKSELRMKEGVTIGGVDVSGMTYDEAMSAVQSKVTKLQEATFTVTVGENTVEAKASDMGLQWGNREVVKEALEEGNSGNVIKRFKENRALAQAPVQKELEFYDNEKWIRNYIAENVMQFETDPIEASISSDGSGGINLVVGEDGLTVNVDESVQILSDYVTHSLQDGGNVAVSVDTDPVASKEDLESITDVLGTYTTYYGSTYGRNTNVERGAELINGHLIKPGESFSVCDHLVPFSAENGYEKGGAYENGRVVQEYGGGICQVSTTLYNALLLAEIEIDERHNHTMSVSYVPTSMDAAIAEGSMDLVFTNNLDTPIFISGYAYGGELSFTVWGKETRPDDRYVYYYSEETGTIPAPTGTVLYPAEDQMVGYFAQVQTASPGSTAVLYKQVTYNGETTTEQVNSSTYESTPNAYEVGTIGATDTLLNAIYNDDLVTAQLAATGTVTIGNATTVTTYDPVTGLPVDNTAGTTTGSSGVVTDQTGTVTDTTGTITDQTGIVTDQTGIVTDTTGGVYYDTSEGEVYIGY